MRFVMGLQNLTDLKEKLKVQIV